MYYFNILEPRIICDKAIKIIRQEQSKISIEIGKLKAEQGIENYAKIHELSKLHYDYYNLIIQLENLATFGVEQMQKLKKDNDKKWQCLF